jgi:polysaccharide export outer membrane protein
MRQTPPIGPLSGRLFQLLAVALLVTSAMGCRNWMGLRPVPGKVVGAEPVFVPAEGNKVSLPPYVIEPPDILLIDALRIVPKEPFTIQPLDVLQVEAEGTLLDQPIRGLYLVEPGGMLNLGPVYGKIRVRGLSLEEAQEAVTIQLKKTLENPRVSVSLAESGGQQLITGEHIVGPDGTINLGTYGSVYVTGLTLAEAKEHIEKHLSQYLEAPLVSVDVFAYNSKVYYVITQGAGFGDNIQRFPVTGNETVLDAISQVNGISRLSSKNIWIARPSPGHCDQILPVRWDEIIAGGGMATNYQVLPGDRIFVAQDPLIAIDSFLSKLLSPMERIFGVSLLGIQTVQTANRFPEGFFF